VIENWRGVALHATHEILELHVEPSGNRKQRGERDVRLTVLDRLEVLVVEVRVRGCLLLRQLPLEAKRSNPTTEAA